jgi:hypothetical protein
MFISYLVYSQIWLNLIWDDRQFFHLSYIRKFLKNIDPIFATLLLRNFSGELFFWRILVSWPQKKKKKKLKELCV